MRTIVAEESIASRVATPDPERLAVVARSQRGRRWASLDADSVVESLVGAGPSAVVMARRSHADPEAAVLATLALVMGHQVVRLPADVDAAAWVLGIAIHPDFPHDASVRRLDALSTLTTMHTGLPRRMIGCRGTVVPSLRPAVLSRLTGCAWRPCERCGGGPLAGAACGDTRPRVEGGAR